MKSMMLMAVLVLGPPNVAMAEEQLYWVVGNRATQKCEIVTRNPVIIGDIWFGDGPFRSMADAELARSTIRACPREEPTGK